VVVQALTFDAPDLLEADAKPGRQERPGHAEGCTPVLGLNQGREDDTPAIFRKRRGRVEHWRTPGWRGPTYCCLGAFGQQARHTSGPSIRCPQADTTWKTTAASRPHAGHFGLVLMAGARGW
jgi:hypothetical protein